MTSLRELCAWRVQVGFGFNEPASRHAFARGVDDGGMA